MRIAKLFFVVLFTAGLATAQSTTTVTGNIKNLGTGNVSQGAFVRFYLRGCAGNLPRIGGTAIIAPTLGNVYYFDFLPTAGGAISGTLYSTRDATGNGNGAIECGGSLTAVWYGYVPFLNGKAGPETPVHAKASATLDISNITPITTTPVSTAPTGDSTYCRLDGGNCDLNTNSHALSTTTGTFSGAMTAQTLNGDLWIGPGTGCSANTGFYSSMAACYAAAVSGQTCHVCSGWSETFAANLALTKNNLGFFFHGAATITMGNFGITKASNINNAFIEGLVPVGKYAAASAAARFIYTGTGSTFSLGDSSADTGGLSLKRIYIDNTGAGSASHCMDIFRAQFFEISDVICSGPGGNNTAIGMILDGTGNFTGDSTIDGFRATSVQIGAQLNNNASNNRFRNSAFSLSATGNIGFDVESGIGNILDGDIEGAATAVKLGNNANVITNRGTIFNQSNTTDLSIGAAAIQNKIDFIGTNVGPVVVDNSPIGANSATWLGSSGLMNFQGPQSALQGTGGALKMFTDYTLKAGAVGPGKGLRITCAWNHSTAANSTTYQVTIDGASVGTSVSTGVDNSQVEGMVVEIMNAAGSQSSQTGTNYKRLRTANVANVTMNDMSISQGAQSTNFANQHLINCTFNVASTDFVTPENFKVELIR